MYLFSVCESYAWTIIIIMKTLFWKNKDHREIRLRVKKIKIYFHLEDSRQTPDPEDTAPLRLKGNLINPASVNLFMGEMKFCSDVSKEYCVRCGSSVDLF